MNRRQLKIKKNASFCIFNSTDQTNVTKGVKSYSTCYFALPRRYLEVANIETVLHVARAKRILEIR